MGLLHHLTLLAIRHSFVFTLSSVRGKVNPVADSLSHRLDSVRDSLVASDFCHQVGCLNRDGSFPPTNEETLIGFATLLADNLTHASIKVYLSVVCSLHMTMACRILSSTAFICSVC